MSVSDFRKKCTSLQSLSSFLGMGGVRLQDIRIENNVLQVDKKPDSYFAALLAEFLRNCLI
jgi:hypothetical protein